MSFIWRRVLASLSLAPYMHHRWRARSPGPGHDLRVWPAWGQGPAATQSHSQCYSQDWISHFVDATRSTVSDATINQTFPTERRRSLWVACYCYLGNSIFCQICYFRYFRNLDNNFPSSRHALAQPFQAAKDEVNEIRTENHSFGLW